MSEREIELLRREIQEIKEILKPMAETYVTVTKLGKWVMVVFTFIAIAIGVIQGVKSILKK